MFARSALVRIGLLAATGALLAAALATTGAGPRAALRARAPRAAMHAPYPDHFPLGPGSEIAARACVICHSAMLVTQQAKDSLGWEKTLALMEKWGAPVALNEHDSLRTYLLTQFRARPVAR